jgi:hypothetical protein
MSNPKSPPKTPTSPADEITGSQKAYEHFLPAAKALSGEGIRLFRADASLAYHNVKAGVDAIAPLAEIKSELPKVHTKMFLELPDLALAVVFAAAQIDRGTDGQTPALQAKASALRGVLLPAAEALAAAGVVPAREAQKIREGKGAIDTAQDCVDLGAFFVKHAKAAKGKTAVTAAQAKDAAETGTELLKRLKPKGTRRKDSAAVTDAVAARDRLWSLLAQRHDLLRRVGMWFWGEDVDAHVPPLQSRTAPPRKNKA